MQPSGLEAFKARQEYRSGIYSYEQRSAQLPPIYEIRLKKNKSAWKFFEEQPPSYRKAINWWILCAKREETRLSRLARLIEYSEKSERIPTFKPAKSKSTT